MPRLTRQYQRRVAHAIVEDVHICERAVYALALHLVFHKNTILDECFFMVHVLVLTSVLTWALRDTIIVKLIKSPETISRKNRPNTVAFIHETDAPSNLKGFGEATVKSKQIFPFASCRYAARQVLQSRNTSGHRASPSCRLVESQEYRYCLQSFCETKNAS